jgi:hypothetical protein
MTLPPPKTTTKLVVRKSTIKQQHEQSRSKNMQTRKHQAKCRKPEYTVITDANNFEENIEYSSTCLGNVVLREDAKW